MVHKILVTSNSVNRTGTLRSPLLKRESQESKPITFTEDQFKDAQAFVKFVVSEMKLKESADFQKMQESLTHLNKMNAVLKAIYDSILELKRVTEESK